MQRALPCSLRHWRKPNSAGELRQKSHQELSAAHYLLAVEPNVEIASHTIDMRFRNPIGAGVLGVRMTKGEMNAGNFFVLQNVANYVGAGGVGADGKFAHPVAILIGAGVSAKFLEQFFVLRSHSANAAVLYFDSEGRGHQITIFGTKIIPHYAINNESAAAMSRGSKNFASREVAHFSGVISPLVFNHFSFGENSA